MKFTIYNLQFTKRYEHGLSLIEILVVVTIFAILGIITTRAVFLTLQGSKKSESLVHVRENLDYSMGVIERQLRNANSVDVCSNPNEIDYTDSDGNPGSFSCVGIGTLDSYIASGSGQLTQRLTSNTIGITSCSFSCTTGISTNPTAVSIDITAQDASAVGIQSATVNSTTQVSLRSY